MNDVTAASSATSTTVTSNKASTTTSPTQLVTNPNNKTNNLTSTAAKLKISDNVKTSSASTSTHKCTICHENFETLNECLKHELLQHSTEQKSRPAKTLRNKVNNILKSFNQDEKQELRKELHEALAKCSPNQELVVILKLYRMNAENMELIYARVYKCLEEELKFIKGLVIKPFGSIASGLALRDSDIDIYIEQTTNRHKKNKSYFQNKQRGFGTNENRTIFNRINSCLHSSECFEDVIAIRQARVPIIKCKHSATGFSLDINISCPSSVHNTKFLKDVLLTDARLHELILFLKIWAKQLLLVGRGNMTSYCLIILILFYLQQNPQILQGYALPSMKQMQQNVRPNVVQEINYAYSLDCVPKLCGDLKTLDLIKGFFEFYKNFEFEKYIVAPYLGKSLNLEAFKKGEYVYREYETQIRLLTIQQGSPAESLQVERCMCVQDPFCLTLNVAKSMTPPNLEYFRKCLQHAYDMCQQPMYVDKHALLYEALLYGIVDKIAQDAKIESNTSQNAHRLHETTGMTLAALNHSITVTKQELKALTHNSSITTENLQLHQQWVHHYIDGIKSIITEIYGVDMQSASPTHCDKQKRLENENLQRIWILHGSVDTWTGRQFHRIAGQSYMQIQLAQSKIFQKERRQNSQYAVQLNGILTLKISPDYKTIECILTPMEGSVQSLAKKDPMRKFFASLKCSLQNFNIKEKLESEANESKRNGH